MVVARPYGVTADGHAVTEYTLENARGMQVKCLDWGGRITSIRVPDRNGRLVDVVLGFDTLAEYEADTQSLGAFVGRYANRIERAVFSLDGVEHHLQVNNGPNHNHGPWGSRPMQADWAVGGDRLILRYHSPAGEDDMPGTVDAQVQYILEEDNTLTIRYHAVTDAATPINLTNHSYFNLAGSGDVLNHTLRLWAKNYTRADENSCPFGTIDPVAGTPMDFTAEKPMGGDIDADYDQLVWGKGYDHNWCLNTYKDGKGDDTKVCAVLWSPLTKIGLSMYTNEPGVQVYTGNFQGTGVSCKHGIKYPKHVSVCLESQKYPDSPNKHNWPSPYLKPGEKYYSHVAYRFWTGDFSTDK